MLLSIIIPVYNVEKYVGECLDSILNWPVDVKDIQIVVVDDGSSDKSASIVSEYTNRFNNIRLIRQENKSLGGARNTGISYAEGEYIWFVDSDDWTISDYVGDLLDILRINKPDAVAVCASDALNNNMIKQRFDFMGLPNVLSGINFLKSLRFSYCVPFTIYKRGLLISNNLRFEEHLYHEDMEFTPRAYYNLKYIHLLSKPLYLVRQNPNSITRSVNFSKNFDLLKVAKSLHNHMYNNIKREDYYIFHHIISLVLNAAFDKSHMMDKSIYEQFSIEIRKNSYLMNHYCKSRHFRYFIEGLMLAIFRNNPLWCYNNILRIFH